MTRREIEKAIADIGAELKKPMSNALRMTLHLDRKELREKLAEMIGARANT